MKTNNFFAVLIGNDTDVEAFETEQQAQAFADDRNADFQAEYESEDDYKNDSNADEYVVFSRQNFADEFENQFADFVESYES